MSYCRFEGTYNELCACLSDVNEHLDESAEYSVDDREIRNFRKMVERFADWLVDNDLIDEDGCLDESALDEICHAMARAGGDR